MHLIDTPHAVNMVALNLYRAAVSSLSAARSAVKVERRHVDRVRRVYYVHVGQLLCDAPRDIGDGRVARLYLRHRNAVY